MLLLMLMQIKVLLVILLILMMTISWRALYLIWIGNRNLIWIRSLHLNLIRRSTRIWVVHRWWVVIVSFHGSLRTFIWVIVPLAIHLLRGMHPWLLITGLLSRGTREVIRGNRNRVWILNWVVCFYISDLLFIFDSMMKAITRNCVIKSGWFERFHHYIFGFFLVWLGGWGIKTFVLFHFLPHFASDRLLGVLTQLFLHSLFDFIMDESISWYGYFLFYRINVIKFSLVIE